MSFNTFVTLAVAALVLTLASSYLLWFGPAARKPFLHKTKELFNLKRRGQDNEGDYQVDPNEHLNITNDDVPLEGRLAKGKNENNEKKADPKPNNDDELIT